MATQIQIDAVVDAVVSAFGGDIDLFDAYLVRAKLETELEALQSEARNLQAAEDTQNAEFGAAILANAEAQQAKQAEIDAL